MPKKKMTPVVRNPFATEKAMEFSVPDQIDYQPGPYEDTLEEAYEITQKPFVSAGLRNIQRQHLKNRMTVWERIKVMTQKAPKVLFQN